MKTIHNMSIFFLVTKLFLHGIKAKYNRIWIIFSFRIMCFIQLLDETSNLEIEGTMNEEIHENVDLSLEAISQMPQQLTNVPYGIHNFYNDKLRKQIDDAYFQAIIDNEELANEENFQASNQS